jgi:hypothetical protein
MRMLFLMIKQLQMKKIIEFTKNNKDDLLRIVSADAGATSKAYRSGR